MERWGDLREALRVNRLGVLWFFSLEGGSIGIFMAFLPRIQQTLSLNDNLLGTAVFYFYLGEMVGTPVVAWSLRRFGTKQSTYAGSLLFSAMLVIVTFADSYLSLCCLFLMCGLAECQLDVSMNGFAVLVERVAGYPICGSFHGSYSLSAAIGGVIGGTLVAANFVMLHVLAVLAAFSFMVSSFFAIAGYTFDNEEFVQSHALEGGGEDIEVQSSSTIDDRLGSSSSGKRQVNDESQYNYLRQRDQEEGPRSESSRGVSLHAVTPTPGEGEKVRSLKSTSAIDNEELSELEKEGGLLRPSLLELLMLPKSKNMAALATLSFLAAFGESALTTWIIFFFQREFDVGDSGALTTLGFSLFEAFMGLGRYLVDTLRARIGSNRMVFYGGCCNLLGMALVIASPSMGSRLDSTGLPYSIACLGCSLTGFGLSTLIPISYISAGYCEGHSATNISVVATWAGAGCIASSPIVGALSTSLGSLRLSLAVLSISLAPICCLAGFVPRDRYTVSDEAREGRENAAANKRNKGDVDLTEPLII